MFLRKWFKFWAKVNRWLKGKEFACDAGDVREVSLILGLGRSPGRGHGYPLQHSCLENPIDRGAWWVTVHGVAESETTEQVTLSLLFTLKLFVTVRGVCNFLGSVLLQQKFEVTDRSVLQLSLFGKQRKIHPRGVTLSQMGWHKRCEERKGLILATHFMVFPPPPEPALCKLG